MALSKRLKPSGIGTRKGGYDAVSMADGCFSFNDKISVEMTQKSGRDFWIRNTGGVGSSNQPGPFFFTIEQLVDEWLQLNRARLLLTLRLVRGPNARKVRSFEDIVAPVNLVGLVLWESIEVLLNDQPFMGASSINSGYKAFIDAILSCDFDAYRTHLKPQFLYPDTSGNQGSMIVPHKIVKENLYSYLMVEKNPLPPGVFTQEETASITLYRDYEPPSAEDLEFESEEEREGREALEEELKTEVNAAFDRVLKEVYGSSTGIEEDSPLRNFGFEQRFSISTFSEPFQLYCPIPHDFFNLNKYIGPGNKIDIKLDRYPDRFLLNSYQTQRDYRLEIVDMKLYLHAIRRRDSIPRPIVERYRMTETQLHKHVIPAGTPRISFRMVHGGILPKTIVVAMVETQAAEGNYDWNPFSFHHFQCRRMALMINGEEYPANGGLEFDFGKANPFCSRAYEWVSENTGAWSRDAANGLSWSGFQNGCFIVPFDLTPDRCNGLHDHEGKFGQIDLEIDLRENLPVAVTVLYELSFNKMVINSKERGTVTVVDIDK